MEKIIEKLNTKEFKEFNRVVNENEIYYQCYDWNDSNSSLIRINGGEGYKLRINQDHYILIDRHDIIRVTNEAGSDLVLIKMTRESFKPIYDENLKYYGGHRIELPTFDYYLNSMIEFQTKWNEKIRLDIRG